MALELSSGVKVRRTYLGKKCCGVFSNLLVDRMHVHVFLLATLGAILSDIDSEWGRGG